MGSLPCALDGDCGLTAASVIRRSHAGDIAIN